MRWASDRPALTHVRGWDMSAPSRELHKGRVLPVQPVQGSPSLHRGPVPWGALSDARLRDGGDPGPGGRVESRSGTATYMLWDRGGDSPTEPAPLTIEQRPDHNAGQIEGQGVLQCWLCPVTSGEAPWL